MVVVVVQMVVILLVVKGLSVQRLDRIDVHAVVYNVLSAMIGGTMGGLG